MGFIKNKYLNDKRLTIVSLNMFLLISIICIVTVVVHTNPVIKVGGIYVITVLFPFLVLAGLYGYFLCMLTFVSCFLSCLFLNADQAFTMAVFLIAMFLYSLFSQYSWFSTKSKTFIATLITSLSTTIMAMFCFVLLEKGNLKTDSLPSNGTLARSEEPVNSTDTIPHLEKYAPGTVIDLNAADTSMLMKIPGIASYRASKIVEYRQRLGGFRTKEQVMEACRMPDEVLDWFTVQPVPLERLEVNHLSLKRLMHHPYISFYQAQAIIEYRKKYGPLHSPQELLKLQDFTPEAIERVQDYLDFRE